MANADDRRLRHLCGAEPVPRWSRALDAYLLAALPVAFAVTFVIGMALERLMIRHLYGRPLETLLATWGISLMLMQAVRMLFGAQNVEVANPSWMSGGWEITPHSPCRTTASPSSPLSRACCC
jgi:branched-subunit amino acid ABC-type transport system permease component